MVFRRPIDPTNRLLVWMLSTQIPLPEVIYHPEKPLYPFYWDGPENPSYTPRHELLVGAWDDRKHGSIQRRFGTQPLNTYLRGHFCVKPIGNDLRTGWARANKVGEFILVQQYFKSGWWGSGNRTVIREQLRQNLKSIPLLRELGILKPDTPVYFMDQSKPGTEIAFGHDPFRLFRADSLPDAYHEWLPQYLREWRPNDFGMPIEEVIDRYVRDGLERGK